MRVLLVNRQELHALADSGIFLIGDSAHLEPILGGEVANNAIIDGIELAKCISKFGQSGIQAFYDSRYPEWESSVKKSEEAIDEMHGSQGDTL